MTLGEKKLLLLRGGLGAWLLYKNLKPLYNFRDKTILNTEAHAVLAWSLAVV